jgi:hypothetical protein
MVSGVLAIEMEKASFNSQAEIFTKVFGNTIKGMEQES